MSGGYFRLAILSIFFAWVFLFTFGLVDLGSCLFSGITFGFTILFVNRRRRDDGEDARNSRVKNADSSPESGTNFNDANNNDSIPEFVHSTPVALDGTGESQSTIRTRTMYRKERMRNGMVIGVYGHAIGGGRWNWFYYAADDRLGFRITKMKTADLNQVQM